MLMVWWMMMWWRWGEIKSVREHPPSTMHRIGLVTCSKFTFFSIIIIIASYCYRHFTIVCMLEREYLCAEGTDNTQVNVRSCGWRCTRLIIKSRYHIKQTKFWSRVKLSHELNLKSTQKIWVLQENTCA